MQVKTVSQNTCFILSFIEYVDIINSYKILKRGDCSLDKNIVPPVYSQIALDIAARIVRGDLKENTKVYGRSVMSSEYGVSPETIRRSMKLLEDMKIVETKQNSGTIVLSAENAKLYVERFGAFNNIHLMQKKLNELIKNQEDVNKQIVGVAGSIVRTFEKFSETHPSVHANNIVKMGIIYILNISQCFRLIF